MATIDDWRMPKIVHFSVIENTEHSIKDISARPKKSTNKELSKQASTETRVVMKSPSGDDRVPRMVHFSDGGIPGHTFNHAADTRPKAILVKEPCSTSTVIKSHGNHDTKKVAKETMPPVTDNRLPKMVHFADGSFPGYVDPNATGARPKMRLKLETKKCAPIETAIERNKPTIMSPKQELNKPTSMAFWPELNESIINTSPDGNYFAKVTCQEESRPDIASFTNVKPVAKERYVGQTYENTYSNFYLNPQDYDKPMEWEKKRNPRNVEEFFSVNREYKESLAFCHPPPKIKHVYSRKLYSFNDPYRTDHFTAHDWAEYSAWEHYEMDYLGRHSSDNIIRKLDQTLAQNAYHPHTYLPYNHSESWWTVRTRKDMTPDVYNQEATGGAEPVQGSSGIDQRYSRERAQRNNSRGGK